MRALSGFTVAPAPESGDKLTRAPCSSQCRAGNVKIPRGSWNEELFCVLEGFPDLSHDDEVDACSGALEMLNPQMRAGAYMNSIVGRLRRWRLRRRLQSAVRGMCRHLKKIHFRT